LALELQLGLDLLQLAFGLALREVGQVVVLRGSLQQPEEKHEMSHTLKFSFTGNSSLLACAHEATIRYIPQPPHEDYREGNIKISQELPIII